MATLATKPTRRASDDRFFVIAAMLMTIVLVTGFSVQLGMGRSTFAAPVRVHLHALVFFGWTMLYLAQNLLVGRGYRAVHRRLGWLSLFFVPAMVVMGTLVTVMAVREGHAPFFFQPGYFLIMNPLSVLVFAALVAAALAQRRRTQWHRRLMFCAMTILLGPGFGRLLPLPLIIPYAGWGVFAAIMLFPMAGVIRDVRRDGRVHPAWWCGIATIVAMQIAIDVIAFSPLGTAIYETTTRGTPGAGIAPLAFPPFPGRPPMPSA